MTTVAEVKLWGRTIGAVALEAGAAVADFEYATDFIRSDIQVAPLKMPLSSMVHRFPELSHRSFHGLPGLLADSLPDSFGNKLIDTWLATQGREPQSFNAVERLCYTGSRGMGALEFAPIIGPKSKSATRIQVDSLVALASDILSNRGDLSVSLSVIDKEMALRDILRVGTSAGGARAKAIVAWNPKSNEVRSGQVKAGEGFSHWVLKFDGVSGNRDKELAATRMDDQVEGVVGAEEEELRLAQHELGAKFERRLLVLLHALAVEENAVFGAELADCPNASEAVELAVVVRDGLVGAANVAALRSPNGEGRTLAEIDDPRLRQGWLKSFGLDLVGVEVPGIARRDLPAELGVDLEEEGRGIGRLEPCLRQGSTIPREFREGLPVHSKTSVNPGPTRPQNSHGF